MSWFSFKRDERGAAAVEFALVSFMLIITIVFIMFAALIVYFNQALDFATQKAARQIMTGYVQTNSIGNTQFRTAVLCPLLPAALSCNNVIINVQTVTEASKPNGYYALVNGSATGLITPQLVVDQNSYSVGVQQSYEYIQVVYPLTFLPGFLANLMGTGTTYNGSAAFLIVSTAVFKNEQY